MVIRGLPWQALPRSTSQQCLPGPASIETIRNRSLGDPFQGETRLGFFLQQMQSTSKMNDYCTHNFPKDGSPDFWPWPLIPFM